MKGGSVDISHEGTRRRVSSVDFKNQKPNFKKGPIHIHIQTGKSILPVTIVGA